MGTTIPTQLEVRFDRLNLRGRVLEQVVLRGNVYGRALGTSPIHVVVGGITASAFPFGSADGPGWWQALLAPDLVDLQHHTVLCPCLPGNGSEFRGLEDVEAVGALRLSVLDLADLIHTWLKGCGVETPVRYIGASLGGLIGLALTARHPASVERLVSISAGLRPDGWGTAVRYVQRQLVKDALRAGDVNVGMARARQVGMLTYRGREELNDRFGKLTAESDLPPVASYLEHHGQRFAAGFPPHTFLLLSEAIDRCHLADTPAEVRDQLSRMTADVVVIGVPADILFPWELQYELYRELQAAGVRSWLWKLESSYGHDAFLADQHKLAAVLRDSEILTDVRPRTEQVHVGREPLRLIRIGMIGCGTVGQALLGQLERQKTALADRYGVEFEVTRIAVRDVAKDRGPIAATIAKTTDAFAVVAAADVDVVVEVAGGLEPMADVVKAALAAGVPVVTANKHLLARRLGELAPLAYRTATPLGCEAAAAGVIPIVRALSHRADEVDRLLGIVNGTTNFMLTRLEEGSGTLASALRRAQHIGLAEADPTFDLQGHDAADKLSLLVYRSFGAWVHPESFLVRGIMELTAADFELARALERGIRHVAHARFENGVLEMAVEPAILPRWHLLANVEEEYNAVYLQCQASGDLSFFGKGAGGGPTAVAVLGDLIDLAQDNFARWPVPLRVPVRPAEQIERRHYLRATAKNPSQLADTVASALRAMDLATHAETHIEHGGLAHVGCLLGVADGARMAQLRERLLEADIRDVLVLGELE